MNNITRIERLIKLRHVLRLHQRAIKRGHATRLNGKKIYFDMDYFVNTFSTNKFKCRTSACAMGSCAFYPYFKDLGLRVSSIYDDCDIYGVKYKNKIDFEAAEILWGITVSMAEWLFDPGYYNKSPWKITPGDVIMRVNALIKWFRDGKLDNYFIDLLCHEAESEEDLIDGLDLYPRLDLYPTLPYLT